MNHMLAFRNNAWTPHCGYACREAVSLDARRARRLNQDTHAVERLVRWTHDEHSCFNQDTHAGHVERHKHIPTEKEEEAKRDDLTARWGHS
jgi:hypothetical protein